MPGRLIIFHLPYGRLARIRVWSLLGGANPRYGDGTIVSTSDSQARRSLIWRPTGLRTLRAGFGYNSQHDRTSIGMAELPLEVRFDVELTAVLE